MFTCGSKGKRIFSSWPVLVIAFHEYDLAVTAEHHAFRQEQNSKGDQLQGTSAIACSMDWQ
ncbi:hypothetical protein [Bradyrhizobium arachidis]|uniref:hypothetical protein n=1 Tax=Bradyrhizobium arachidis TaxID=858423 RepID=UPI000B80D747|nr:hypothetical protein [Bradyrhizobium arachidis]